MGWDDAGEKRKFLVMRGWRHDDVGVSVKIPGQTRVSFQMPIFVPFLVFCFNSSRIQTEDATHVDED